MRSGSIIPVSTGRSFIVCPDCGNKRCPKATHHGNACTGSNAPGPDRQRVRVTRLLLAALFGWFAHALFGDVGDLLRATWQDECLSLRSSAILDPGVY